MNEVVLPGSRRGTVRIPASKSHAHRLLLCAALGGAERTLSCDGASRDIDATAGGLTALGATVTRPAPGLLRVTPLPERSAVPCRIDCGESGTTLRFLLPLAGALGAEAEFRMAGRLPQRPLAPLDEALCAHGMRLERADGVLRTAGTLRAGDYTLPGDVSSQYISGLLMALPLLAGESTLTVTGAVESAAYITMTEQTLRAGGVRFEKNGRTYTIPGGQRTALPQPCAVEGDWSNAAFFLCAGAFSSAGITVEGLSAASPQGDRAVTELLRRFGAAVEEHGDGVTVRRGALRGITVDAAPVPDLIPALCVVAAAAEGESRIVNAARLRLKESDRLSSTADFLSALGADVTELADGLVIRGRERLRGGVVSSWNDHRIAMAAAVAAGVCRERVVIEDSRCTEKSYPRFWTDLAQLKGERL